MRCTMFSDCCGSTICSAGHDVAGAFARGSIFDTSKYHPHTIDFTPSETLQEGNGPHTLNERHSQEACTASQTIPARGLRLSFPVQRAIGGAALLPCSLSCRKGDTVTLQSKPFLVIGIVAIIFNSCSHDNRAQEVPEEFKRYITTVSQPVEYKEITPFYGGERATIPGAIRKHEALEDIQILEYLLRTSYSGFEYWKHKGVDFESYFAGLRDVVSKNDTLPIEEFEEALSKILTQIYDGHISLMGTTRNHAYRHESVYYCDVLVDETERGVFRVIDSQCDMVTGGDVFTQNDRERYLFKTLSPTGRNHYLIGMLSYTPITFRELSFNEKNIRVPFFRSRLTFAKFNDPEPFYVKRENGIPILRINSFANELYSAMEKFMESGNELRNENTIVVNIMYNGGGSSSFPQTFIRNLNGVVQWETHWAILKSPPIIEYFAEHDLGAPPGLSPDFRNLVLSSREELAEFRSSPVRKWEFTSTHNHRVPGSYTGTLIILTNRNVLSGGEAFVGASQSVKNRIVIGENTGGSAQFPSACGYCLPNSKFIANLPRHFIVIPGLEECIGYLPDYWLNTSEPVKEVMALASSIPTITNFRIQPVMLNCSREWKCLRCYPEM